MRIRSRMHARRFALAISIGWVGMGSVKVADLLAQSAEDRSEVIESSAQDDAAQRAAELDATVARIGATLRCPVCRQQSVAESSARISREMQGIIRSMLVEGKTPQEIEAYFVESYGPWILLRPKAEGANLVVYLGPLGAFLLGGLLLAMRFRQTRRARPEAESTHERDRSSAEDNLEKEDRDWLDAALRGS